MSKVTKEKSGIKLSDVSNDATLVERIQALKEFKHEIATSILKFTDADGDTEIEARLSASLLFLVHLSQEIIRGFANSDRVVEEKLFNEAQKQAEKAYKINSWENSHQYLH